MKKTVIKYSLILLIGLLIECWIIWFSPLNLPERITPFKYIFGNAANNSISVDGLLLIALFLSVLIIAIKSYFKENPATNILNLTVLGTSICIVAEMVFQAIRQLFINVDSLSERVHFYLIEMQYKMKEMLHR